MVETKKAADYENLKGEAFWTRKMRSIFRRLDERAHGFVCLSDLLNVATDMLGYFPKVDSFHGDKIVNSIVALWFTVMCSEKQEKEGINVIVNESSFVDNMLEACKTGGSLKDKFTELLIEPFFAAADEDEDGKITTMQFKNMMRAWRCPDGGLDLIFRLADGDHDGKLIKDEFEFIMAEFFFNELARSKTAQLFGQLVNHKRPEDYGTLEFNPYWEGKMRTMFRRFDITQCNKLRSHDFIQIGRNIATRGRLDKKRANNVLRAMIHIWVKWVAVDKEGKRLSEVTEKEFLHNLRALLNGDYRHEIDQFGWTFFKAMEIDGNGYVTLQEYRNLQEAWGVGREEAEGMFKVLDIDKDNKLSSDEFLSGWVDYFCGEDSKSQYKGFFGPVITKHENQFV